jgi:uncharacterized damage-inducible protein DinB
MPREIATRFQRWFEYECDAHAKTLRSLESVPAERRTAAEFAKALGILAHVAAARRLWLARLGIAPGQPGPLFPQNPALADVTAALHAAQAMWSDYLARVTDEDIARVVEYQSIDGGRFRNRVEDILAQLFGHSSYHRGQIAVLVRAAGGEPAITDLIFWCREPIPPAG